MERCSGIGFSPHPHISILRIVQDVQTISPPVHLFSLLRRGAFQLYNFQFHKEKSTEIF